MSVSIVLPVYNEEKYIRACLQSLTNQTKPADQIFVVDNNSTDNSVSIAREFPVTILHEKKQGMTPTRNRGFNVVQSNIIARTDADTIVPKNWVEQIQNFMLQNDCDGLLGATYYERSPAAINAKIFSSYAASLKVLFGTYPLVGQNMAITRRIWLNVRDTICEDDRLVHEDIDLSIHIHKIGGTICFDRANIVRTSTRRLVQKPQSFFLEYPHRLFVMKRMHT